MTESVQIRTRLTINTRMSVYSECAGKILLFPYAHIGINYKNTLLIQVPHANAQSFVKNNPRTTLVFETNKT